MNLKLESVKSVNGGTLTKIAEHCGKNLTTVYLGGTGVTDAGVEVLATNCKNLTTVGLDDTGVTDAEVGVLATNCKNSTTVHLNGCTGVTGAVEVLATTASPLKDPFFWENRSEPAR